MVPGALVKSHVDISCGSLSQLQKYPKSGAEDCLVGKSAIISDSQSSISATHMVKGLCYSAGCPLPTYMHVKNVPKLKLLWASVSLAYKEGQNIGEEACVLKLISFRGRHDIAVSRQESKDTGF